MLSETFVGDLGLTYSSSMFGWKMRFTKPILGLLYGYWSGSSTWIFHRPPAKGADMKSANSNSGKISWTTDSLPAL
jgi:hypothetical protein